MTAERVRAFTESDILKNPGRAQSLLQEFTELGVRIALDDFGTGYSSLNHLRSFPGAQISFEPDLKRQRIVDSWPADVNDDAARRDWGFAPRYDLERAFTEYLVPTIRERYR